ncbi:MAG: hypothetical protein FIB01_03600 [Gemmatimonadetes bacterium]|nr:hypothetical protein [Gemmatimonadota bacterium]
MAQAARASAGSGGAEPGGLAAGTPAGGREGWIGEVRAGLAGMPELAERDPAAAKNRALQLYVTRQEYIEMYYGTAGRAVRGTELAEAVVTAESRFHALHRGLNPPDGRVDVRAVGPAAGALRDQYDLVLQRARQLGLDARRLRLPAGGAP